MREPRRTSMGVRGDPEDTHTITRLRVAEACAPLPSPDIRSGHGGGAFDAFGHLTQGQLAQVGQVLLLEEMLQRPRYAIGLVDLAGPQPFLQILDGEVEVDHLIGLLEKAVGNGFAHDHAGNPFDQVIEAFQVLHVEGADDIDAGVDQLEHVEVATLVAAVWRIGVCQLIDQGDLGFALEDLVQAHLLDDDPAVFHLAQGHDFKPIDQRRGFDPAVGFDEADDHVHAALPEGVRLFKHSVRLAHPGGEADVELEPAALALLYQLEEILGARTWGWVGHGGLRVAISIG